HAEERQGTGGRDFGWDFEIIEGLARSCRGCEPRGFHLSERGTHHASVGGQSVATVYGAEARESRPGMGNFSGTPKDERQLVQKGGRRCEGGIRPEGPRVGCELGGLYKLGPGTEASSRQKTRSSRAWARIGKPSLME